MVARRCSANEPSKTAATRLRAATEPGVPCQRWLSRGVITASNRISILRPHACGTFTGPVRRIRAFGRLGQRQRCFVGGRGGRPRSTAAQVTLISAVLISCLLASLLNARPGPEPDLILRSGARGNVRMQRRRTGRLCWQTLPGATAGLAPRMGPRCCMRYVWHCS